MQKNKYYGIGRRKSAVARVYIFYTKQQETNFQVFDDLETFGRPKSDPSKPAAPGKTLGDAAALVPKSAGAARQTAQPPAADAAAPRQKATEGSCRGATGRPAVPSRAASPALAALTGPTDKRTVGQPEGLLAAPVAQIAQRAKISDQNQIIINNKKLFDYFQNDQDAIKKIAKYFAIFNQPLIAQITVSGGGTTGQKEAICLALARAFYKLARERTLTLDENLFILNLKKKKLLTQDARIKERKKYGLKKARKAPQYSKR